MASLAIPIISSLIGLFGHGAASSGKQDKGKFKQLPTMDPSGRNLVNQFAQGTSGALPGAFSYLQDLFSQDSKSFDRAAAPHMRNFRENTIPELSTLFAGLGAGSSSGFQQALGQAGAGLEENLAALRGQQQQSGLSALQSFGQLGTQSPFQSVFMQGQPSRMQSFGQGLSPAFSSGISGLSSYFQNQDFMKQLPQILAAFKK